jgi:hypothetical protein
MHLSLNTTDIAEDSLLSLERIVTARIEHVGTVLMLEQPWFQSFCACGWSSTVTYFEEADLLRAMHAHAVVTFGAYRGSRVSGQD